MIEDATRVTAVEGTVENGQVKLPASVRLPENAKVYVIVPGVEERPAAYIGSPRFSSPEQAVDFVKEVVEETFDAERPETGLE